MNNQPYQLPQDTPVYTPPAKPRYPYRTADTVAAFVAWVMGYLFWVVTPVDQHLWSSFLFITLMFVGAFVYFKVTDKAFRPPMLAYAIAGLSILLTASLLYNTDGYIQFFVFLFACLSWFYTIFLLGNNTTELFPGSRFVGELCRAVFVMPFSAKGNLFGAMGGKQNHEDGRRRGIGKQVLWVILGLLIALCPTLVVGILLSYDEGFTSIINTIFKNFLSFDTLFSELWNVVLGLLLALLLFGALLACRDRRGHPETHALERTEEFPFATKELPRPTCHILPVTMICAALTPILLLYVIFFISQWDYYVSAFTGIRPEALTFSEYARSGFFQLCAVAGINAGLGLVACGLVKHRNPDEARPCRDPKPLALKLYMVILSVFTLILIATALAKMYLYVDAYGLTHKRVFASWFMILLAICFVAVCIRQFFSKMNLTGTVVCIFLICFTLLSLCNVDGIIARYNINAALDGNLKAIGGDVLQDTDVSGVLPALSYMEEVADKDIPPESPEWYAQEDVRAYLELQARRIKAMEQGEKNITVLIAERALVEAGYISAETTDQAS